MNRSTLAGRSKTIVRVAYLATTLSLIVFLSELTLMAQTTSFTYQGKLTDNGSPANGNYDLQFALFDSLSASAQIGSTQTLNSVLVSGGVFSVQLDFGANAFSGASRFLEISARVSGSGAFTTLTPRQRITSTPYAVRSLNASSADSVPVSAVPAGSANYIQANPQSQQSANFNISGNGTAGGTLSGSFVNAGTQYNIAGGRVLSIPGNGNTLVGTGQPDPTGTNNSIFGLQAGHLRVDGADNSIFGSFAGWSNQIGNRDTFFGAQAGFSNSNAESNTYVGFRAGFTPVSGTGNTFIGAGADLTFGQLVNSSTAIGFNAKVSSDSSTAIGNNATANCAHCIVLGDAADGALNVGIGTTAPASLLHLRKDVGGGLGPTLTLFNGGGSGGAANSIDFFTFSNPAPKGPSAQIKSVDDGQFSNHLTFSTRIPGTNNPTLTERMRIVSDGHVGVNISAPWATFTVRGQGPSNILGVDNSSGQTSFLVSEDRTVAVGLLSSSASANHVCIDFLNRLAQCSSSLRFKENVLPFSTGLELISRLRPIRFTWKHNGTSDIGLGAEDVAKVEPLLVTHNEKGEIQGVRYDQLSVVLINAIKEQQGQIAKQQQQIEELRMEIRHLRTPARRNRR